MRSNLLVALTLCVLISQCVAFKKSRGVPGGYNEVDLSNPPSQFLSVVNYIKNNYVSQCKNNSDINSSVQLYQVIKAYYQVVAGMNYEIIFKADHYTNNVITIKVFAALPQNGVTEFQINECK